ncbi:MAG: HFLK protein [Eubacteriales bacterium]|jgi:hypothetical protein|nr:HFLK protein [Eubacteriales bacterium]
MPDDFGYFGKGLSGYTHYMQAFDRNKGGGKKPDGGKGGCLTIVLLILLLTCFGALLKL